MERAAPRAESFAKGVNRPNGQSSRVCIQKVDGTLAGVETGGGMQVNTAQTTTGKLEIPKSRLGFGMANVCQT